MEIAKALILTGHGGDHRPWPTAPAGPKHLFPVANRPILFHNLEALRAAGVLEATILVEPDGATEIERAVGDGRDWGLTVNYEGWCASTGVCGALSAGRSFVGEEPVLVQQGDALLRGRMHSHISAFAREQLDTLALRLTQDDSRLPRSPVPGYLLSPRAVSILLDDPKASSNPVAGVRALGGRVRVQRVNGCLPCHGDQDTLLESNRHMLEGLESSYQQSSLDDCRIQGAVVIHETAQVRRTLLRGPAIIGPGAVITDAYIGPYTSVGAGVVVEGSQIEYSIVLPRCRTAVRRHPVGVKRDRPRRPDRARFRSSGGDPNVRRRRCRGDSQLIAREFWPSSTVVSAMTFAGRSTLRRLSLLVVAAVAVLGAAPSASMADACTPPVQSAVACENLQTGTDRNVWEINGAGDPDLQGFATRMSVNKGETIQFKIKASPSSMAYHINIYRLGYYGGDGARLSRPTCLVTGTSNQAPA